MSSAIPVSRRRGDIRALTKKEFGLFKDLIYRDTGIFLSPSKQALLVSRLSRRLRELGLDSFGTYYTCVTRRGNQAEKVWMLERICTHETHFFREPRQFEFLQQRAFPAWEALAAAGRRTRRIRAWSAACSTGQEPFSLGMLMLSQFPPTSGWSVEIVATDLSTRILSQAEEAVWPIEKAAEISSHYRKQFMLKGCGDQKGRMKAGPLLRSAVRFQQLNLNERSYPLGGDFDLILCRNVLIYFNEETRKAVLRRILTLLAPGGHLLLGHAETLRDVGEDLDNVGPSTYARPLRTARAGAPVP